MASFKNPKPSEVYPNISKAVMRSFLDRQSRVWKVKGWEVPKRGDYFVATMSKGDLDGGTASTGTELYFYTCTDNYMPAWPRIIIERVSVTDLRRVARA
jgi:hypothetical protein